MKAIVILLLIAVSFSSCDAIRKAIDEKRTGKAKLQFDKHPDTAAHYCAVHFPLKDSIAPIIYVPGDNLDYTPIIDSILHSADSLSKDSINKTWTNVLDTATTSIAEYFKKQRLADRSQIALLKENIQRLHDQYKPCKPDTVYRDHFKIGSPELTDAQNIAAREKSSRIATEAKNAQLKDKLNWWKIACLITWAIVVIYFIILIFKPKI